MIMPLLKRYRFEPYVKLKYKHSWTHWWGKESLTFPMREPRCAWVSLGDNRVITGFIKGLAPENWLAVRMILSSWFDHIEESFSKKRSSVWKGLLTCARQCPETWNPWVMPFVILPKFWGIYSVALTTCKPDQDVRMHVHVTYVCSWLI